MKSKLNVILFLPSMMLPNVRMRVGIKKILRKLIFNWWRKRFYLFFLSFLASPHFWPWLLANQLETWWKIKFLFLFLISLYSYHFSFLWKSNQLTIKVSTKKFDLIFEKWCRDCNFTIIFRNKMNLHLLLNLSLYKCPPVLLLRYIQIFIER